MVSVLSVLLLETIRASVDFQHCVCRRLANETIPAHNFPRGDVRSAYTLWTSIHICQGTLR